MKNINNRNLAYLKYLLPGVLVINVGFTSIMFQLSTSSDIENAEDLFSVNESSGAGTSTEAYLTSNTGTRKFFFEPGTVIPFFQKSIGFLAIVNIIFITLMVFLYIFGLIKMTNVIYEPDRCNARCLF